MSWCPAARNSAATHSQWAGETRGGKGWARLHRAVPTHSVAGGSTSLPVFLAPVFVDQFQLLTKTGARNTGKVCVSIPPCMEAALWTSDLAQLWRDPYRPCRTGQVFCSVWSWGFIWNSLRILLMKLLLFGTNIFNHYILLHYSFKVVSHCTPVVCRAYLANKSQAVSAFSCQDLWPLSPPSLA